MTHTEKTEARLKALAAIWARCLAQAPLMNMMVARERFNEATADMLKPQLALRGNGTLSVMRNGDIGKPIGEPLPMPDNFSGDWQTWLRDNRPDLFTSEAVSE